MTLIHRRRSAASARPDVEASANMPLLNKETWEYLELKLWHSFSRKIWALTAGILSVAGLLGLLGLDAWVKSRVDQILIEQREDFDVARKGYQEQAKQQLLANAALFALESRLQLDQRRYEQNVDALKKLVTDEQWKLLTSKEAVGAVLEARPLSEKHRILLKPELDELQKTFGPPENPKSVVFQLEWLANGAAHVHALRVTVDLVKKKLFEAAQADASALVEFYERTIYPEYFNELKKRSTALAFVGSEATSINSLIPDARTEFRFYIPSAADVWDK